MVKMICNIFTDLLQACRSWTNIVIHKNLAKIIDKEYEYDWSVIFSKIDYIFLF